MTPRWESLSFIARKQRDEIAGSEFPGFSILSHISQAWSSRSKQPGDTDAYMQAEFLQSCPTLCDPMDYSPPGSSVPGILQARILEWEFMPSSRRSSWPRDQTHVSYVSCIGRQIIYHWDHLGSLGTLMKVKVIQLCLTLCDLMDYTVYGILHARILEWAAVPFSRGSSQSRNQTQVSCIAGGFFTSSATREH